MKIFWIFTFLGFSRTNHESKCSRFPVLTCNKRVNKYLIEFDNMWTDFSKHGVRKKIGYNDTLYLKAGIAPLLIFLNVFSADKRPWADAAGRGRGPAGPLLGPAKPGCWGRRRD